MVAISECRYDVVKTLTGGEVLPDLSCTTDNQEGVSKHPEVSVGG